MPLKLNSQNWKHQNPIFIFHYPHPKFWVFESWKQWSKTKPNRWPSMGPTRFGWWIMKIEWYHSACYPNMLLNFDMGLGSALSCIESVKMQTSVKYLSRIYIPNGFCAKKTMNPSLAFFRYKISEGSHLKITYLFLGSI